MLGLVGKKLGMTQVFNAAGEAVPVTVIEALPATILALLTKEKNGYEAVKLASGKARLKTLNKADAGQFTKSGMVPAKNLAEFRVTDLASFELGKELTVSLFENEKWITVCGTSKGCGFQGTIKRHGFSRGPMSHGSHNHRAPGSIGAHTFPARVFPGQKLPGHMGDAQKTVKNLELVRIDVEKNLLFVKGAVPGPKNSEVIVRKQHG